MSEVDYYRQAHLWGQGPDDYQVQVRADLLQMLPTDVESLLDVGCGDGFLTDALPEDLHVVGVDISDEALRHVRRETRLAAGSELPFGDRAFDLVMSNDVLEHLDDAALAATVAEFDRVARRYVLLTVPFGERLEEAMTRCGSCGEVYHVNHHVRSWDEDSLGRCLGPGWRVAEFRHSGALLCSRPDPLAGSLRAAGIWHHWPDALCPRCGAGPDSRIERDAALGRPILDGVRARAWWGNGPAAYPARDRSELMALWVREGADQPPRRAVAAPERVPGDLLEVRFDDPLRLAPEWTPGASVARFALRGSAEAGQRGLRRGVDQGPVWAEVVLPAILTAGDRLEVTWSGDGGVRLYGWDAVLSLEIPLAITEQEVGRAIAEVDQPWLAGRYGTIVQVHADGDAEITACRLLPDDRRASAADLLRVPSGHSVEVLDQGVPRRSWGCYAPARGTLPRPVAWSAPAASRVSAGWPEVLGAADEVRAAQGVQLRDWIERIQALDAARHGLKEALATERGELETIRASQLDLEAELQDLREVNERLERERARLPAEINALAGENDRLRTRLRGGQRVQRVLEVASWFPWEPQPGLGSFVHEQAMALREVCDLDVRVLCGRPFWVNTIRPWAMARGLAEWRRQLERASWSEWEGVPVLQFPYLVGMPFPFFSHSWTYRLAARRLFRKLGRAFRFDVVHAHTAYLDGSLGLALREHFDVPVAVTEHTGPFTNLTRHPWTRSRTVRSLTQADRAWAVSHAHAEEIRAWLPEPERLGVMHNGVDTERFRPAAEPVAGDPAAPRFVAVGVFEEVKNPWLLLEAFERVHRELPDAKLCLIGDGPMLADVRARVADSPVKASVAFPGRLLRVELAEHLRSRADVLVIASRAETFGLSSVEALASGLPVVATRCGGPEDVVTEPWMGRLVANEDPADLASGMLEVARGLAGFDPKRLAASASSRFDRGVIARRLHEDYTELVLERAGRTER